MDQFKTTAEAMAVRVRETFDDMSNTDQKLLHAAVLRATRKALARQLQELKNLPESVLGDLDD